MIDNAKKQEHKNKLYALMNEYLLDYENSITLNKTSNGYKLEKLTRDQFFNLLQKFIVFHISQIEEIPKDASELCKELTINLLDFRTKNTPTHKSMAQNSVDAILIDFINFIARKTKVKDTFITKERIVTTIKATSEEENISELLNTMSNDIIEDALDWEKMDGDTELEKKVNSYLTCRFITQKSVPKDECLQEAKEVIELVAEFYEKQIITMRNLIKNK